MELGLVCASKSLSRANKQASFSTRSACLASLKGMCDEPWLLVAGCTLSVHTQEESLAAQAVSSSHKRELRKDFRYSSEEGKRVEMTASPPNVTRPGKGSKFPVAL